VSTTRTSWLRFAAVATLASTLIGCPSGPNWRDQALALSVEGLAFHGDKIGKQGWSGSGFWVSNEIIATNAHVATRANVIHAKDDKGNKYRFTTIVGIDRQADIAYLKADRPADVEGVEFYTRPDDPRDLRGRHVIVTGNTGGLGISYYNGEITNVVGKSGNEQILHNANTAGGASGSPLFDEETNKVVGINHSSHPQYNTKMASSSWRIEKGFADAKNRWGTDLKDLFNLKKLMALAEMQIKRNFCVNPGQGFKVPFNSPSITDLVVIVKTQRPDQVLAAGFKRGNKLIWKGALKNQAILPFMFSMGGPHEVVVVNPKQAKAPVCGIIGLGAVLWEKGIK